jgi:hypothetical protein
MSAESEFPLPGEPGFKYPDKPETLGALWDALKAKAQTVSDATAPVRNSATAIQNSNTGRTADSTTRVVTHVSGRIDAGASRLRWFERPITDYLAMLTAVRAPINTLRDKWREGEADLRRLQNQEAVYVTDEPVSYAEKWAVRQTELQNAYLQILSTTVDPGKNTFVAALRSIAEDREPAATQPISLPQMPDFARLPGIYPMQPGQPPPTVDPDPRPGDDDDGGNGNGNGNGNGSGTGDPDPVPQPQPEPEPNPEPEPEPEPGDPTPSEILTEWFADHPTDGAATAAAWLLLPIGAATYAQWAASPAGRTSMATWLVRPRQQAAYDAFLATPEAKGNLTAWIEAHGGLEEGEAPPADPVAWINDPTHAAQRSQWLADPATREVVADWMSDPANATHRTAWLSDPKTQNGLVGWMRDPASPANGQAFAEWTKHPTDIEPLTPPPPEPVEPPGTNPPATDPPASGVQDPGTTGVPPTTVPATTDVDDPATVPTPV